MGIHRGDGEDDGRKCALPAAGRAARVAAAFLVTLTACGGKAADKEKEARRLVEAGNASYEAGEHDPAIASYESALKLAPDAAVAHLNLAVVYLERFRKAPESPSEGRAAIEHFAKYLEAAPTHWAVARLLTTTALDTGEVDSAITYWEERWKADAKNLEALDHLSVLNRRAERWDEAVKWLQHKAEATTGDPGKVDVYLQIAALLWSRLRQRDRVFGRERLRVADAGISALQAAESLAGTGARTEDVQAYLSSFYQLRSIAHAGSWARAMDRASAQYHRRLWRKLHFDDESEPLEPDKEPRESAPRASGKPPTLPLADLQLALPESEPVLATPPPPPPPAPPAPRRKRARRPRR